MDENKAVGDGFEALLEEAVAANFCAKMNAMPSKEETLREHPFSAVYTRKMEKLFAEERRKPIRKRLRTFAKAAVLVLFFAAVLFAAALAVNPQVRAAVWDAVVRFLDDHTEIEFREPEGSVIKEAWDFSPQVLPPGYTLVSYEVNEISYMAIYENPDGDMLIMGVNPPGIIGVDNEHLDYYAETYDEITYHINESHNEENDSVLAWLQDDYMFSLIGSVSVDELLAVAQSIE